MPQSLSDVLLHLIYSTKNREAWIDGAIRRELFAYKVGILLDLGCPSLTIGGMADHVHILYRQSRTQTISDVVQQTKQGTSRWIKTKSARYQGFAWQQGYGVFSVSESNVDAVRSYIDGQSEHHRVRTFQEESREFLARHHLSFDERYVWD